MPDKTRQHKLTDVQKEFILYCLACGFGYQEIVECVKDEFDRQITRQNVNYYAEHYAEQISDLKRSITDDITRIPFARAQTRLAYLDRVAKRHYRKRQYNDFRSTLKQIADEVNNLAQIPQTSAGSNYEEALRATAEEVWGDEQCDQ